MRQAVRSQRWFRLVLGLGLPFVVTGAALAANDLFTYASDGGVEFRLSGDGKVFAYSVRARRAPIASTLIGSDGTSSLPEGDAITGLHGRCRRFALTVFLVDDSHLPLESGG